MIDELMNFTFGCDDCPFDGECDFDGDDCDQLIRSIVKKIRSIVGENNG